MARRLTDDDLLNMVRSERERSIGFGNDTQLTADRIKALQYISGEMKDVPNLENRSAAVSMDIADAIETILPDLVEIFTGGDDDFAFRANDEKDEAQAAQETDYVNKVVFRENDGFLILTSIIKDALEMKTGVARWCWEDRDPLVQEYENKTAQEAVGILGQGGEPSDGKVDQDPDTGEPLYSFKITQKQPGQVKVYTYPPEDFTVAADTVILRDTTYCAGRTRPRAQELIADGYKRSQVDDLNAYVGIGQEGVQQARDTVAESNRALVNGAGSDEPQDLRVVEIVDHFLRVDADGDGKPEIVRLVTGNEETILLEKEIVDRIQFSACKPFLTPHRFYGNSLADVLMQVQKIRTALTRIALDSAYFAINQRAEIAQNDCLPETVNQYLDNTPGMPILSKTGNAIKPLENATLGFDPFTALEYFATVGEARSGIVRNAQGLNPDTLHDTAAGAMALMTMAQKRVRLIARMIAETGLKDLFLGVHALLRKHSDGDISTKLRGKWTKVDPSKWVDRSDMTVEIGLGASGKDQQQADLMKLAPLIEQIIKEQGGTNGPFITPENFYAFLQASVKSTTLKTADSFFSDPASAPPAPPPGPNPEVVKAQGDQQLASQKLQIESQNDQDKMQRQHEVEGTKLLLEHEKLKSANDREDRKLALQKEESDRKFLLETTKLEEQRTLAILELNAKYQTTIDSAQIRAAAEAGRTIADLHMDETGHEHERGMQDAEHEHAERLAAAAPEAGDDPNPTSNPDEQSQ